MVRRRRSLRRVVAAVLAAVSLDRDVDNAIRHAQWRRLFAVGAFSASFLDLTGKGKAGDDIGLGVRPKRASPFGRRFLSQPKPASPNAPSIQKTLKLPTGTKHAASVAGSGHASNPLAAERHWAEVSAPVGGGS